MSFTSEIKKELFALFDNESEEVKKAEKYGLLLFSKIFSSKENAVSTENSLYAHKLAQTVGDFGAMCDIKFDIGRKSGTYIVSIPSKEERETLIAAFGHKAGEIALRINYANIAEDLSCKAAFLRGAFISAGSVSDPYKDYHLEFTSSRHKLMTDLSFFIREIEDISIEPMLSVRNGKSILYIKDSEKISDFLIFLGAQNASMEIMQAKMFKEVRNNINRKNNFETANIDKTINAAVVQNNAINKIINSKGLEFFPADLRELVVLRMENPDMSLRELSEKLGLSRSGINHRLKRIILLSENLEE